MKKLLLLLVLAFSVNVSAQNSEITEKIYSYESVQDDPREVRIYTLDNGLKVYLMKNTDQPRIQTAIAVNTGGKNDPAETTGLAHYLEHIMFKGTTHFGTTDYQTEKPMLDQIEALYETYRQTTDPAQRTEIYHQIDSISYEASKIAIANEYDKLMAGIGSSGSNAFTSEDETVYIENIPSNELENWAVVQSDRFKNMIVRGFHTELESVYEEYNRSLTQDIRKVLEAINQMLFKNHSYGLQTVIGNPAHLKNPSITNIINYFNNYYHPGNVAVCMCGNLDYDETIRIIDRYFGDWKPNPDMTIRKWQPEEPIRGIQTKDIYGHESDMVAIAWRLPGKVEKESEYNTILEKILYNEQAGLFDLNINQQQKALTTFVYLDDMSDYSALIALGYPKEGQTLDEVKGLMLTEIGKMINGDFDQSLLTAIVNNTKKDEMKAMEENMASALKLVDAFINHKEWKDEVELLDRLGKVKKSDLINYAKKYVSTDNYVCVYKHQGDDPNEMKIDKPAISPIEMNRDKQSAFVDSVLHNPTSTINPEYANFEKDIDHYSLKNGNKLLYRQNKKNGLFTLRYVIENGSKSDNFLPYAVEYLDYLGTKKLSNEEIKEKLFALACDVRFYVAEDQTHINISGLAENEKQAMELVEDWINNAQADQDIYEAYVDDLIKSREIAKTQQQSCMARLNAYCTYGPVNEYTNIPSETELKSMKPDVLIQKLKDLSKYRQTTLYYGPTKIKDMAKNLDKIHKTAKKPIEAQADNHYHLQEVDENEVYVANYDSKAIHMAMYSNNGQTYDPEMLPEIALFNEYFGGGMNTVVFQEMRESRGLAYQASADYETPEWKTEPNIFTTYVISQNDKMGDCIDVFNEIIENMPVSENAFELAKQNIKKSIEVKRFVGFNILYYYMNCKKRGLDRDINSYIYPKINDMNINSLKQFAKENVEGRKYKYIILGSIDDLDMDKLNSIGKVHVLTLEEIFGY